MFSIHCSNLFFLHQSTETALVKVTMLSTHFIFEKHINATHFLKHSPLLSFLKSSFFCSFSFSLLTSAPLCPTSKCDDSLNLVVGPLSLLLDLTNLHGSLSPCLLDSYISPRSFLSLSDSYIQLSI